MKYIVYRLEPDSYALTLTPFRVFNSWEEAMALIEPFQKAGQRGWRIAFAWEPGETIHLHGGGVWKDKV